MLMETHENLVAHVKNVFERQGYVVEPFAVGTEIDLTLTKDGERIAVLVKWLKANATRPMVQSFQAYLDDQNEGFTRGFFITTQGFSRPALALLHSWGQDQNMRCGVVAEDQILWVDEGAVKADEPPSKEKVYLGVFTCKGGVGKTTVSAHLAGAFALQGHNVALIDLDPEQNLKKLIGDGLFLPGLNGKGALARIDVFDAQSWDERAARDVQIVICDCSPMLECNDQALMERLDYCLIPTTLNPMGLNKHGKVINETFEKIRIRNKKAHLFVVINNYRNMAERTLRILLKAYVDTFQALRNSDPKFHFLMPREVAIRESEQLFYWGLDLLENPDSERSELAFQLVGGRSAVRDDFIALSDYIEQKTGLGALRSE